jgi:uncharacterized lipoprotein YddW (UPF0748 family)
MIPRISRLGGVLGLIASLACGACASAETPRSGRGDAPTPEVRGTWITTTANTAIATPADSATTMRRLREIGLNTVYVETWKNGYTQYPSEVLMRTIGVDRRPNLMPQDPSDTPEQLKKPARDLLEETLIEAHRNQLVYIAWFEYGFMAAHKDTMNHLRRMKPEWLSRDIKGNEVAPNGFVWMNPLHPEARRFLLDLVLEAVDRYDLDGVQLDDRIVWPYVTMGYDDYTREVYAREHGGKQPPDDHKDPAWMRWRADKVNEYAKKFVQELRAKRPGLIISLSPAVYPWCWENYLLEWPKWAGWTAADGLKLEADWAGNGVTPSWDEFIPQNYRFSYDAFEKTWLDQVRHMKELGANRQADLIAGIRLVGEGKDSSWDQLRQSIELAREQGNGGHVHWFSRGVLDVFPKELTEFYDAAEAGPARHPKFPAGWRPAPIVMSRASEQPAAGDGQAWQAASVPAGAYRVIASRAGVWSEAGTIVFERDDAGGTSRLTGTMTGELADGTANAPGLMIRLRRPADSVELLRDRRAELNSGRPKTE